MARFTRRAEATGKADTTEGIVMKRSLALVTALAIAALGLVFADGTPIQGLHRYRLDNGLELPL